MAANSKHGVAMAKAVQVWPLSKLVPYQRNARVHVPEQVQKIADSIRTFGFNSPILVDSEAGIIAGHGRYMAAQLLSLEEVPVIVLDHMSEAERRAYIIADNKISDLSGWDEEMLKLELGDLQMEELDLSLTGFDDLTLGRLLSESDVVEDPAKEWSEMPQYEHRDLESKFRVIVHFANEADRERFSSVIGQKVGPNTRSIWYPEAEIGVTRDKRY